MPLIEVEYRYDMHCSVGDRGCIIYQSIEIFCQVLLDGCADLLFGVTKMEEGGYIGGLAS